MQSGFLALDEEDQLLCFDDDWFDSKKAFAESTMAFEGSPAQAEFVPIQVELDLPYEDPDSLYSEVGRLMQQDFDEIDSLRGSTDMIFECIGIKPVFSVPPMQKKEEKEEKEIRIYDPSTIKKVPTCEFKSKSDARKRDRQYSRRYREKEKQRIQERLSKLTRLMEDNAMLRRQISAAKEEQRMLILAKEEKQTKIRSLTK